MKQSFRSYGYQDSSILKIVIRFSCQLLNPVIHHAFQVNSVTDTRCLHLYHVTNVNVTELGVCSQLQNVTLKMSSLLVSLNKFYTPNGKVDVNTERRFRSKLSG